ncbi:hypothetical protein [Dactylosporangium matsuzakiense]|uniref:Uncharacterized protein n=1 Tax=Dactylosporangium matsuzakiense TaxID=53360 RepID=A0A9W6KRY1_9ACTN|nr:hypothetical protein [Dactylosporangium matsuzakiense]UWZ41448.1 hypothetical protein Dmats_27700 [Dactylosporangium matsuzakiense]GLL07007.1 hypothetical protein GCM10017581_087580 [Dactylosporangium matsuzakiense]
MPRTERPAHRLAPRPWPERLAHFGAIAVPIAVFVAARWWFAPWFVTSVSRLSHGSPTWMFLAGWASTGLAPAAALVLLLDGDRRERQLGGDPRNRPRAARGHGVPGRTPGYWLTRLPLILVLLVAFVYAPSRGGSAVDWSEIPGGDAFRQGWHLSLLATLPAVIALLIFRLFALLPGHGDRLLRMAGPVAAAAPALALIGVWAFNR